MDVQFTRRRPGGSERRGRRDRAEPELFVSSSCARAATELQKLLLLLPYRLETFVERATDITRLVCTLAHRVIRRCDSDDITPARARARDAAMLVKCQLRTMENSPEDLRRCRMRNCCAIKDSKSAHSRFPPRAIFRGYSDTFRNLIARISDFYSERLAILETPLDLNITFHALI